MSIEKTNFTDKLDICLDYVKAQKQKEKPDLISLQEDELMAFVYSLIWPLRLNSQCAMWVVAIQQESREAADAGSFRDILAKTKQLAQQQHKQDVVRRVSVQLITFASFGRRSIRKNSSDLKPHRRATSVCSAPPTFESRKSTNRRKSSSDRTIVSQRRFADIPERSFESFQFVDDECLA